MAKNGGSAFPVPLAIGPAGDVEQADGGMTLRQWYAGLAMAAMVQGTISRAGICDFREAARAGIMLADALLAAEAKE